VLTTVAVVVGVKIGKDLVDNYEIKKKFRAE
jgi:hypothetical protein